PPPGMRLVPEPRKVQTLTPASFGDLPNWANDDHRAALAAFRLGCVALKAEHWRGACGRAQILNEKTTSTSAARAFFEAEFVPNAVSNDDGSNTGLVTGYYEPVVRGSRQRRAPFVHPLYGQPDDLVVVDLTAVSPELRNLRLRGRLDGRKVVPYYNRAEIESGRAPVAGKELLYLDDPIEAFFLQIQGSGRVRMPDGTQVRIGYAEHNGHPYRSIGRWLIDQGEMKLEQASMQGIQAWARANPTRLAELLNQNPSYVFFREVPPDSIPPSLGARGALGVPLSPERSIAVDQRFIPLGAPVYLATTRPNTTIPLERLMTAQDIGSAIRGAVRADFYWGVGQTAGEEAGRMRQSGRMWVLLPRGFKPE
ncbi:MAG: murein transglycosylase A, partial [Burkholderiales bacterium]